MSAWLSAFASARALAKEGEAAFADFNPSSSSEVTMCDEDNTVDNDASNNDDGAFRQPKQLYEFMRGVVKSSSDCTPEETEVSRKKERSRSEKDINFSKEIAMLTPADSLDTLVSMTKRRSVKVGRKVKRAKLYNFLGRNLPNKRSADKQRYT